MLDELYVEVRAKVLGLSELFLDRGGRVTLIIDALEDVNRSHDINFLAVVRKVVVFQTAPLLEV